MRRLGKDTSNVELFVDDFVIKLVRFYFHELWGWKMAAVKLRIQVSGRAWTAKNPCCVKERRLIVVFYSKSQGLSIIKIYTSATRPSQWNCKSLSMCKNISCYFMLISLRAFFHTHTKKLTNAVKAVRNGVRDVERN